MDLEVVLLPASFLWSTGDFSDAHAWHYVLATAEVTKMYCPLCKAEYRAGPTQCSDCLVGLVHTREQADAAKVVLLWEGMGQDHFNSIVAALRDANIPNCSGSGARPETGLPLEAFMGILGLFRQARTARRNMSWQVFVLESDFPNAEAVLRSQKPD